MNDESLSDPMMASVVAAMLNDRIVSLQPLAHGQNNRIFKVQLSDRCIVTKRYFQHPLDHRDRLGHEWSFMSYLWQQGLRCIPEPLAVHRSAHIACYSFVPGTPFAQSVTEHDVGAAGNFYAETNLAKSSAEARGLPRGAEAAFSIAGHLSLLWERLDSLVKQTPPDHLKREYLELTQRLQLLTTKYESWIRQRDPNWEAVLPLEFHFLSASDFGFHNCIRGESGNLFFLDFEYAGWDDPGRSVCDFFLQPRIHVPDDFKSIFLKNAFPDASVRETVRERAHSMLPLIGLRWCCIMLNVFSAVGAQRRRFAGHDPSDEILGKKLELTRTRALKIEALLRAP